MNTLDKGLRAAGGQRAAVECGGSRLLVVSPK